MVATAVDRSAPSPRSKYSCFPPYVQTVFHHLLHRCCSHSRHRQPFTVPTPLLTSLMLVTKCRTFSNKNTYTTMIIHFCSSYQTTFVTDPTYTLRKCIFHLPRPFIDSFSFDIASSCLGRYSIFMFSACFDHSFVAYLLYLL